jgi:tryptophan synthase alpha chain
MTDRYSNLFQELKRRQQTAFVPFVTLHDPDFDRSLEIIQCLIDNGADALELGIPFSDPIADGPVIQKASIRALQSHSTVSRSFEIIEKIRAKNPDIPIGLLVYSNLVVANGMDHFYSLAARAKVDSVLIADVPILEADPFISAAKSAGIKPIFIATPNASDEMLKQVAEKSEGYTYLLSRAGVTGTEVKAEMPVENIVSALQKYSAPPSLLGFGISTPEQVAQAIKLNIGGVISGSAVVKIIQDNLTDQPALIEQLSSFIRKMKQATSQ